MDGRRGAGVIFWLKVLAAVVVTTVLWVALVLASGLGGWLRAPLAPSGDTAAFADAARRYLDEHNTGNAAYRLLSGGKVVDEHYVSVGEPVDRDTLFQVASLSKWVTAWGVLALVDQGRIDLDAPVNDYLGRWLLPAAEHDPDQVTVRRLLSHTAGLTDGLGYGGFEPGESRQTLEASLSSASDASPGADGRTRVGMAPGREWRYSGGGYTLLQLLIEEVSGLPFEEYMRRTVLRPLGMTRSTFEPDLARTDNVATFYDTDGAEAVHYRFTALAAASLYTSVADLSKLLGAHVTDPPGRGVLSEQTLALMRTPHAARFGADIWGLGVILYAPTATGDFVIGHDGNNEPAINTAARVDPVTGDGIIVLETGAPLLATALAGEWVFWQTGVVDTLDVIRAVPGMTSAMLTGTAVIALLGLSVAVMMRRRRNRP
ncbi:MAG: serine hydrolase domain-containing protein [Pseudomonadales bacterium]